MATTEADVGLRRVTADELPALQQVLDAALGQDPPVYNIHPGDLAWWAHHRDPRWAPDEFWLRDGEAVIVIGSHENEITAIAIDTGERPSLVEWAQSARLDGAGEVGWIAETDLPMVRYLEAGGYQPVSTDRSYRWDLTTKPVPEPFLPSGWTLRSVTGEEEADNRRQASHAAFESTMDPDAHLERYLKFMRSPVYEASRDLVAVAPDGRIASFMVWWPSHAGVAQIEPFGTHPDFHRQGVGKALLHFGLGRMKVAGMNACRVVTNDWRDATSFYERVGFTDVGGIKWWGRPGAHSHT